MSYDVSADSFASSEPLRDKQAPRLSERRNGPYVQQVIPCPRKQIRMLVACAFSAAEGNQRNQIELERQQCGCIDLRWQDYLAYEQLAAGQRGVVAIFEDT